MVLQLFVTIYLPECFVANARDLPQWKSCLVQRCLRACSFPRGRGLTFASGHVLVRAHVDGPGVPSTGTVDHTLCVSRALMHTLAALPPHVCHRQRDWAVSIGSHMQQDIDIAKAPPHLGAPVPLFEYRSRLNTTIQYIGDDFP